MSNKGDQSRTVKEYAFIAFTLLGVLFGMVIMNFIFSTLGNASADGISDISVSTTNRSDAFINTTTYTIPEASVGNFSGNFVVVFAVNASGGETIAPGNWTIDAELGTLINASAQVWDEVNVSYTLTQKTAGKVSSEEIQNNSLQAIVTYTNQSSTQFNVIAIAITLIVLIGVFLVFWKIFVKDDKGSSGSGGNFG